MKGGNDTDQVRPSLKGRQGNADLRHGRIPPTPLPKGGVRLPLNWDFFTNIILKDLNGFFFQNFLDVLDASGMGSATLNLIPVPGAEGTVMHFAYALALPLNAASNAVEVEIVP